MMKEQIEEFIKRRFPIDCNWMNGNCYHFAVILNNVFGLPIYYLPIEGHFVVVEKTENKTYYYDYLGQHELGDKPIDSWEELHIGEPLWIQRIYEDCVK